jgi:MFS family permease
MTAESSSNILTRNFILGFLANFLFFGTNFYLIPVLPLHLHKLGSTSAEIGLVIGSFSLTAIFLRPLVGRISDTIKKKRLMSLGAVIFIAAPPLYATTTSLFLLTLVRFFHGVGIAAFAASSAALVPEIVPREKLGQATGLYVTSVSIATGLAPLLGSHMSSSANFLGQMLVPSIASALALLLVLLIKEDEPIANTKKTPFGKVIKSPHVIVPTLIFTACSFSLGTITAFLPLYTISWNYNNPGLFFAVFSLTLITIRFLAGSLPDRYGRDKVIMPSLLLLCLALCILSASRSPALLALTAVVYGTGYSLAYPSLNAWVVEYSPPSGRGSAMGIFSASVDAGAFLGPLFMGMVCLHLGYSSGFLLASAVPLAAFFLFKYTIAGSRSHFSPECPAQNENETEVKRPTI